MMMEALHIVGGRIVDPACGRDEVADICVVDGVIVSSDTPVPEGARRVDADGLLVVPGLIDIHVHLREPGNEDAETVESGMAAAHAGGFATITAMPNTTPSMDCAEEIIKLLERSEVSETVRVLPCACVTKGRLGRELADMEKMAQAGAAAFSDDGASVWDDLLMREAMVRATELDLPIMNHALDAVTAGDGVMREGAVSRRLGLQGMPAQAESMVVRRDVRLAEETGCRIHIQHISCRKSVEIIREARARGVRVTGEVTPHHLSLTDEDVVKENTNFKMNPPLGTREDQDVLVSAVIDGVLSSFATDHAPHMQQAKNKDFCDAPFGVVGLETAIGVTYTKLVKSGLMSVLDWVSRWTTGPAGVLGIEEPSLTPGQKGDLTLIDVETAYVVKSEDFLSRSRNTPFEGMKLWGRSLEVKCFL